MYKYTHMYTHCHTCLGDDSRVFAVAWLLAQAAEVFTIDTKHIFIAHDQIWSCAVCSSVVFINGEPFLKREKQWYYSTQSLKHKTPKNPTLFLLCLYHLGLQVRLLDGVSSDLTVAVIPRGIPLQSCIKTPDVCHPHFQRRPRLFCSE